MPARKATVSKKACKGSASRSSKKVTKPAPRKAAPAQVTKWTKSKKDTPQKAIFKNLVISSVGGFVNAGREVTHEQFQNWVTSHGGRYEREVTDDITHLICDIETYRRKPEQVQRAWRLGKKRCTIVVFDWLLDCLARAKGKRLVAAKGYSPDVILTRMKKGKQTGEAFRRECEARFDEGVKASKELCDSALYSVHTDGDGFEYKIILTRINLGGRAMIEKYTLYLFESHALPHVYLTGAKFTRSHRPATYYRDHCHPMCFKDAFKHFQKFFKDKTGKEWDQRLEKDVSRDPTKFTYIPPPLGRPVGLLPLGYLHWEERLRMEGTEEADEDVGYDDDSEVGSESGDEADIDEGSSGHRGSETTKSQNQGSDNDMEDLFGSSPPAKATSTATPIEEIYGPCLGSMRLIDRVLQKGNATSTPGSLNRNPLITKPTSTTTKTLVRLDNFFGVGTNAAKSFNSIDRSPKERGHESGKTSSISDLYMAYINGDRGMGRGLPSSSNSTSNSKADRSGNARLGGDRTGNPSLLNSARNTQNGSQKVTEPNNTSSFSSASGNPPTSSAGSSFATSFSSISSSRIFDRNQNTDRTPGSAISSFNSEFNSQQSGGLNQSGVQQNSKVVDRKVIILLSSDEEDN